MVFSCDINGARPLQSLQTDDGRAHLSQFVSHAWCLGLANPSSYLALWHTSCAYSHTRCAHGAHAGCSRVGYGPSHDGQCHMPPLPPGSAAIAPTGCAHAHVAALAQANPRARCPSHAWPLAVRTSASAVERSSPASAAIVSGLGPGSRASMLIFTTKGATRLKV